LLLVSLAAPAQAQQAPREVRAAFLHMLDRPRIPLDPRPAPGGSGDALPGMTTERLSIATEKKRNGAIERVPMVIVRPAGGAGRRPAVIVLHGTGGSKDGRREQETLARLAARGIVAVGVDARYHGDRANGAKGADAYNAAILAAWREKKPAEQEHPFYYDTVWDLWRTIDYLQSRPDIDPARLGMIGFSMGGIETWLAASVDERIKVAVPASPCRAFAGAWSTSSGRDGPRRSGWRTRGRPGTWVSRRSMRGCAGPCGTRSFRGCWISSTARACCGFSRRDRC
jgi:dienelactone hydrolase